jgi:hypothetical protein
LGENSLPCRPGTCAADGAFLLAGGHRGSGPAGAVTGCPSQDRVVCWGPDPSQRMSEETERDRKGMGAT